MRACGVPRLSGAIAAPLQTIRAAGRAAGASCVTGNFDVAEHRIPLQELGRRGVRGGARLFFQSRRRLHAEPVCLHAHVYVLQCRHATALARARACAYGYVWADGASCHVCVRAAMYTMHT